MNDVLGFFSWLLIELPASMLMLFQDSPLYAGAGVALLVFLVILFRRGRRKRDTDN